MKMKNLAYLVFGMIFLASANYKSITTNTPPHKTAVTKDESKDCPAANRYYQVVRGQSYETSPLTPESLVIKNLEKQSLVNNACGADSLRLLEGFYSKLGDNIKAKYYQKKLVAFADSNNTVAIESLCTDLPFGKRQMNKYCEIIVNDNTLHFSAKMKEYATHFLASDYYQHDDVEPLSRLCSKTNNAFCFYNLKQLSDALYDHKKFDLSKKYHHQLINYYENFFINSIDKPKNLLSKDRDLNKIYNLIELYRKEGMSKKLINLCTGSLHRKLINEWDNELDSGSCIRGLWDLGTQDFDKKHYNVAMKLYKATYQVNFKSNDFFKGLAAVEIADMYHHGKGIEKDNQKALEWYNNALEHLRHKDLRANIYGTIGVILHSKHDRVGTFQSFKKSAELGSPWYQANLALMYYHGDGVIQDYMEAYAWASVALAIGIIDPQHKSLAESIKRDAGKILIYRVQPGATLKNANELAKKHFDSSVSNIS